MSKVPIYILKWVESVRYSETLSPPNAPLPKIVNVSTNKLLPQTGVVESYAFLLLSLLQPRSKLEKNKMRAEIDVNLIAVSFEDDLVLQPTFKACRRPSNRMTLPAKAPQQI